MGIFSGGGSTGGGSQPVQAYYTGAAVTVTDGNGAQLPFTTLAGGTELLDRASPVDPTLLADGTYALTLCVGWGEITPGGHVGVSIGGNALPDTLTDESSAPAGKRTLAATFIASEGATLSVSVTNQDGAESHDFQINSAFLVKLA